jgi:unsaturated rhamnogalacturonyl hydrolase
MIKTKRFYCFLALCFAGVFLACGHTEWMFHRHRDVFWDAGNSPQAIAKRITGDLLGRTDFMMYWNEQVKCVHYAEACAGFGAVRFAGLVRDTSAIRRLSARYMKVIDDGMVNTANHVDANVYGILPLELSMQTGERKFFRQGLALADGQWENPLAGGLTNQTRFWIDDVWMIGSLQVQAFRATGRGVYLERAALETDAYLKKLQQANGLFHHGENSPFFWGRGNGWVAAGLAELLSVLPESNPHHAFILAGYVKMMDALLRYQCGDGMWRQLIDREESWKETSSTAMFGYAITLGVKKGILKKSKFSPAYRKAWLSLVRYVDASGKVGDVCVGTGKGDSVEYYLNRPRTTGDLHGQAPVLWFAWSLLDGQARF